MGHGVSFRLVLTWVRSCLRPWAQLWQGGPEWLRDSWGATWLPASRSPLQGLCSEPVGKAWDLGMIYIRQSSQFPCF